jgi:aminoglycoside 6'-N-acetyltransferase
LRLRPATIDDLALLQHWDEQPRVIASDPNDDWEWDRALRESPPRREQRIADVDDAPNTDHIVLPLLGHPWNAATVAIRRPAHDEPAARVAAG